MIRYFFLLPSFLSLVIFSSCQTAPKTSVEETRVAEPQQAKSVMPFQSSAIDPVEQMAALGISPEQIGFVVYDPATRKMVAKQNADRLFIPSSVTKVVSTVAALKILGPDFQFKTYVLGEGKVGHGGKFQGNIVLKGTGDPFLTAAHLMTLAEQLKEKGIRKIHGNFFYDDTYLASEQKIDPAESEVSVYNAGVSALSCEFNRLSVHWKAPESEGLEAYPVPELPLFEIGLSQDAARNAPSVCYQPTAAEGRERWVLSPWINKAGKQFVPVKNPAYFTALLFQKLSSMQGLELPMPLSGNLKGKSKTLAVHSSAPLHVIAGQVLEYSNNLMAELVQLSAAQHLSHQAHSIRESAEVIRKWLIAQSPSVQWKTFRLVNGSGLGSENRMAPLHVLGVLKSAENLAGGREQARSYLSLLPISGWKGTLDSRMTDPELAFRVWAKTGTQSFSSALAGYFFTRSGKKLLFTFFATNEKQRARYEQAGAPIGGPLKEEARQWQAKVFQIQEAYLRKWVSQ